MTEIGFYLTDQTTNKTVQLPVNPSDVSAKYETDDKQEMITNLGQVNLVGLMKLTEISIQSSFPVWSRFAPHYAAVNEQIDPEEYIELFKAVQQEQRKFRLVVSGTPISELVTISNFEYKVAKGADEYTYTLGLRQYREFSYTVLKDPKKKGKKKAKKKKRSKPAGKISVGSTVIVNGRLHADSWGRGAGQYEHNAKRKVIYINPGKKYPICVGIGHIARGWVRKSEVRRA